MKIKIAFGVVFIFLLLLLFSGPYTVLVTSAFSLIKGNPTLLTLYLQRIFGLIAFALLFIQLVMINFEDFFRKIFNDRLEKLHCAFGIILLLLVVAHAFLFLVFLGKIKGVYDPFYIFTDYCVLCRNYAEYFINLGRVSVTLMLITGLAAVFRKVKEMKKYWRQTHVLMYLTFPLVSVHLYVLGSDAKSTPFFYFYILANAVALFIIAKKSVQLVKKMAALSRSVNRLD